MKLLISIDIINSSNIINMETANKLLYEKKYLLDRLYDAMKIKGVINSTVKIKLVRPIIFRKDRRTIIENFETICQYFKRSPQEVINYIKAELSITDASVISAGALKLKGMYEPGRVSFAIQKFARDFVICKQCRSMNTKSDGSHHTFCHDCGSRTLVY